MTNTIPSLAYNNPWITIVTALIAVSGTIYSVIWTVKGQMKIAKTQPKSHEELDNATAANILSEMNNRMARQIAVYEEQKVARDAELEALVSKKLQDKLKKLKINYQLNFSIVDIASENPTIEDIAITNTKLVV